MLAINKNMKISILAALIFFTCESLQAQNLRLIAKTHSHVPDLVGLTFLEAKKKIKIKRFILGSIILDSETDATLTDNLIVFKQNPPAKNSKGLNNYIAKGKVIDLWLLKPLIIQDTLSKTRDTLSKWKITLK